MTTDWREEAQNMISLDDLDTFVFVAASLDVDESDARDLLDLILDHAGPSDSADEIVARAVDALILTVQIRALS